jgi:hypothetical protein
MDSQFNTLTQSFHDNYLQYKITGDSKYQTGYKSAQQGLDAILSSMKQSVASGKADLHDFYKSGVEERIQQLDSEQKSIQSGIRQSQDEYIASQMRLPSSTSQPIVIPTSKYITIGVLTVIMFGLYLV